MPDQPAASPVAVAPPTPAAALSTAALLAVAAWVVFNVGLSWGAISAEALAAAAIILSWRYLPQSPAAALNTPTWQYVLGLVIVVSAGAGVVGDIRYLAGNLGLDLLWLAGTAAEAVVAFMAWAAIVRIKA